MIARTRRLLPRDLALSLFFLVMFSLVIAVAVAFSGCKKKEPTLSERMNSAVKQAEKAGKDMSKEADKAAADAKKQVDEALKK